MRHRRQPTDSNPATTITATEGEVFPDGSVIELVSEPAWGGEVRLLFWDGREAEVAIRIDHGGKLYAPIQLAPTTRRALWFPSRPVPYGSTRQLFEKIVRILEANSTLRERDLRLLAFFVMASWFSDILSTAPCILLSGRSQSQASRLLRLLWALCRRGFRLMELTPASLYGLPMNLRPTLLINQFVIGRNLAGLLRSSNQRGTFVARSGGFMELNGARAIFAVNNHLEPSATQGMLRIPIPPEERALPILDEKTAERIAADLQPELLEYRLRNYVQVGESTFDAPGLTAEMRDLARGLSPATVDDVDLADELTRLLGAQDQDERATTNLLPEYAIVFSVLSLVHERKLKTVIVQELAKLVNVVLRANGEVIEFSPQDIGYRLRAMGLFTRRSAAGQALRLDRELSRLIHNLAQYYGIPTPPGGYPGCPDCEGAVQVNENRLLV
jgi:hypothetical protein